MKNPADFPPQPILASLARLSDFDRVPYDICKLPREQWATGDYVVGEIVAPPSPHTGIELTSGRWIEVAQGDTVVGALGIRTATLEAVGDWREIGDDGRMQALTSAGLFARATSISTFVSRLIELEYCGHAVRGGVKARMKDFVPQPPESPFDCPTVLIIGTSMSSGKTTAAKVIIRRLKRLGLKVAGAKLTGAGRYRDILAMGDAGADAIFDFVDVGLPSTVCPASEFADSLETLLGFIAQARPDVVVAEAGASPLEPYNGEVVVKRLREQIKCTVLCASDPYAVVGVTKGFGFDPDLVAGVATSTSAGVDVVHKLTGVPAMNLVDPGSSRELDALLKRKLSI